MNYAIQILAEAERPEIPVEGFPRRRRDIEVRPGEEGGPKLRFQGEGLVAHQFPANTSKTPVEISRWQQELVEEGLERERRTYRGRTVAMLRRYMRHSIETGRLPSLLGREIFRAKVTSYTVVTFEDRVIFVHDMEKCLDRLDEFSRQLIARHILQEHDQEATGRLLQCDERTVRTYVPIVLDVLSEILMEVGLMKRLGEAPQNSCQGGKNGPFSASDCEGGKYKGNNILAESIEAGLCSEDGEDDEPSWWDDEALLMAVDLGYDEGGCGDTLLVSVQAGIVQKAKKLKTSWKADLNKAKIPFFHSVDYSNFDGGQFRGMSRQSRQELLSSLTGHIRKRLLFGMTAKVTLSYYNAEATPHIRSVWGTAYSFAIQMLMLITHEIMEKQNLGIDINVLIEDGHANSEQMLQILGRIKKAYKTRPSEIPFNILNHGLGSKKDHPILQAADMLAYSDWQRLQQKNREIYDALHVKGSRYRAGYVDLDKQLVGEALGIAKRSDIAKALLSTAWFYENKADPNDPRTKKGLNETQQRIREFRQKYEKADDGITQRNEVNTGSGEDDKAT